MIEVMQSVWGELTARLREKTVAIAELNARTYRALQPVVGATALDELRRRYYTRSYPSLGPAFGAARPDFEAARKRDDLSAEQRQALEAEADRFGRAERRLLEKAADTIDAYRAAGGQMSMDMELIRTHQEELRDHREAIAAAQASAQRTLAGILGEAPAAATAGTPAAPGEAVSTATADLAGPDRADEGDDGEAATAAEQWASVFSLAALPQPITDAECEEYARLAGLDDGGRAILDALHADYLDRCEAIRERELAAAAEARAGLGEDSFTEATIEALFARQAQAVEAILAEDDAFLAEVASVLFDGPEDPRRPRLEQTRRMRLFNQRATMAFGVAVSHEPSIDLVVLLAELRLDDATRRSLDAILDEYRAEAAPMFRRRYDATAEVQRAQYLWGAQFAAAGEDDDFADLLERAQAYRDSLGAAYAPLEEVNEALAALNRSSRDRLLAALPPETAAALRRLYDRTAFPTVCVDPRAAHDVLDLALALDDLAGPQRSELADLAATYRPAYAEVTGKMVDLCDTRSGLSMIAGNDPATVAAYQQRENRMARLRFERDELNAGVWRRLDAILAEDQRARLGPAPPPAPPAVNPFAPGG
jgi:hypothetical protein